MIFLIISFWTAVSFVIVKYISKQILEYRKIKTIIIDLLEKKNEITVHLYFFCKKILFIYF